MVAWILFLNPVQWPWGDLLWLVLPLSASLAIVYKTIRTKDLRRLPLEILGAFALVVLCMSALMVGLWLIQDYLVF